MFCRQPADKPPSDTIQAERVWDLVQELAFHIEFDRFEKECVETLRARHVESNFSTNPHSI